MKTLNAPSQSGSFPDVNLASALRGDGKGNFDEIEVRKAVRALKLADRTRL